MKPEKVLAVFSGIVAVAAVTVIVQRGPQAAMVLNALTQFFVKPLQTAMGR